MYDLYDSEELTVIGGRIVKLIRKKIESERLNQEISSVQVADAIGISHKNYMLFESGEKRLNQFKLFALIVYFNISIDDIIHQGPEIDSIDYSDLASFYEDLSDRKKEKLSIFIENILLDKLN